MAKPSVFEDTGSDVICNRLFYLNLKTMSWSIMRTRGDEIQHRDEHTAVYDEETKHMILFGGFEDGIRVNTIVTYNFAVNSWKIVEIPEGGAKPCPRSGHSAVIY